MTRIRAASLALLLAAASPVHAASYALLMNISDYPPVGVSDDSDLPGTPTDVENFRKFATRMGIPSANITRLADAAVSRDGVAAALKALADKVTDRDQVLITYSGHGNQVPDPQNKGRCIEGMVTHEGSKTGFLSSRDLKPMVDAIAAKAAKVVVFFDSCFSGGAMTTRSVKPKAAGDVSFRPKFYPRADQASWTQCGDPVNMRSLPRALQEGKNNLVFIAAADFNEVALDGGPRSGGLATSSWMNCLNGKADKDKSGALSAQELAECAHEQVTEVSQRPPLDRNKAVQHITIEGNRSLVMAFNDDGKGKPAPTPAPTPTPTPTPAPVATDTGSPLAMLNDLYQSRNPQWSVELKPGKERVNFRNKEIVELGVTSKKDGYLYLVMVGSSNKEGYILFPNEHDPDNQVRAGQSVTLPKLPASGKKWKIVPGGPAGTDHILALVSETPLNLEDAPTQKVGQFKAYKADRNILSKLQRTFTRDLVAVSDEEVSLNFGAAMAKIVEFE